MIKLVPSPVALVSWLSSLCVASEVSVPCGPTLIVAVRVSVLSTSVTVAPVKGTEPSSLTVTELPGTVTCGAWLTDPTVSVAVAFARLFAPAPSSTWIEKVRSVVSGPTTVLLNWTS